jgi:uncharacterized membrane protein YfcA
MVGELRKTKLSHVLLAGVAMLLCAGTLFAILLVFDRDWMRAIFGLCVLSGALIVLCGLYLKMSGELIDDISDRPGLRSRIVMVIIGLLIVGFAVFSFVSVLRR